MEEEHTRKKQKTESGEEEAQTRDGVKAMRAVSVLRAHMEQYDMPEDVREMLRTIGDHVLARDQSVRVATGFPWEIVTKIAFFLDPMSYAHFALSCRRARNLLSEENLRRYAARRGVALRPNLLLRTQLSMPGVRTEYERTNRFDNKLVFITDDHYRVDIQIENEDMVTSWYQAWDGEKIGESRGGIPDYWRSSAVVPRFVFSNGTLKSMYIICTGDAWDAGKHMVNMMSASIPDMDDSSTNSIRNDLINKKTTTGPSIRSYGPNAPMMYRGLSCSAVDGPVHGLAFVKGPLREGNMYMHVAVDSTHKGFYRARIDAYGCGQNSFPIDNIPQPIVVNEAPHRNCADIYWICERTLYCVEWNTELRLGYLRPEAVKQQMRAVPPPIVERGSKVMAIGRNSTYLFVAFSCKRGDFFSGTSLWAKPLDPDATRWWRVAYSVPGAITNPMYVTDGGVTMGNKTFIF